jgi:hypothetical protein
MSADNRHPIHTKETVMSATVTPTTRRSSARARVALVIAALLALGDLSISLGELGEKAFQPVALIVLAALTAIAIPFAWRGVSWARATVAATRVVAGLFVAPAFFDGELPAFAVVVAAIWLVVSLAVAVLLFTPSRSDR